MTVRAGLRVFVLTTFPLAVSIQAAEWPHVGGDPGGTSHSSLEQINHGRRSTAGARPRSRLPLPLLT